MTTLRILSMLLVTMGAQQAFACSCMDMGRFAEFSRHSPNVARITVIAHGKKFNCGQECSDTMSVAVNEVIRGDVPIKELTLYGDTGMSCLTYIDLKTYPIGSEHLIILQDSESLQPLLGCGEPTVAIVDNTVVGKERDDRTGQYSSYRLSLDQFIKNLKSPPL